jgi:hypothetical protein
LDFFLWVEHFKRENERVCEEIVACPFVEFIEAIVNEPKKKKFKKSKQEINKVYQNRMLQGLFDLNLLVGK